VGGFFNLLNPYALVCGVTAVVLFTLHGALFLTLKTEGELRERARTLAAGLGPAVVLLLAAALVYTWLGTDFGTHLNLLSGAAPVLGGAALLAAGWFLRTRQDGWAFALTGVTIATGVITLFAGLFPRVMVSSLNPDWSLTIYSASSSHYTLTVMSLVALVFVPVMLAYQIWTYWVFRQRVSRSAEQHAA